MREKMYCATPLQYQAEHLEVTKEETAGSLF